MSKHDEQIRALLQVRALAYAKRTLGVPDMSGGSYREVFTVTRADIDAYVAAHGVPPGGYDPDPRSRRDGLHFYREGGRRNLLVLERGIRVVEEAFDDDDAAQAALVDWLLKANLTGLDFSRQDRPGD